MATDDAGTDTADDTCRLIEVDGEVIRVLGGHGMDDEDRAAFAEIVRAAKRRFDSERRPVQTRV